MLLSFWVSFFFSLSGCLTASDTVDIHIEASGMMDGVWGYLFSHLMYITSFTFRRCFEMGRWYSSGKDASIFTLAHRLFNLLQMRLRLCVYAPDHFFLLKHLLRISDLMCPLVITVREERGCLDRQPSKLWAAHSM